MFVAFEDQIDFNFNFKSLDISKIAQTTINRKQDQKTFLCFYLPYDFKLFQEYLCKTKIHLSSFVSKLSYNSI